MRSYMPEFLFSHYEKIRDCQKQIEELNKDKSKLIQEFKKG